MKRDWNTRSAILLAGLVLVALNLVGLNLFGRLDLTDDRVYSLSDASIELVKELEDPVTVTAFFTEDLPARFGNNRRFLKDKLDDYTAYGGRQFQYRFVDPGDDEELRAQAQRYGIPPVQVQVIESDNMQLKNAYMGMVIEYGGKREVTPVVQDLSSLEYDITSSILRLTRPRTPTVGFLTGHGEPDPEQALPGLTQTLGRDVGVVPVVVQGDSLDSRPDALLVIAPTDSLSRGGLKALDTYTMEGGRIAFLLNRVLADLQSAQAFPLDVNLDSLLTPWGMRLEPTLVMDAQNVPISVRRQMGGLNFNQQIPYPFFVLARSFNEDHPMVNRLGEVPFYFVSTVDTSLGVPAGVERDILAWSSARSALQRNFFQINVMPDMAMNYQDGPFPLAAAWTGSFPSAFQEGLQSLPTRMILVGDGDFANESLIGSIERSIGFMQNMVDWLLQDEAMLSVRARSMEARMLRPVPDGARPWIKYANMLGPVFLVMLFGLWRWSRRRNRQWSLDPS